MPKGYLCLHLTPAPLHAGLSAFPTTQHGYPVIYSTDSPLSHTRVHTHTHSSTTLRPGPQS